MRTLSYVLFIIIHLYYSPVAIAQDERVLFSVNENDPVEIRATSVHGFLEGRSVQVDLSTDHRNQTFQATGLLDDEIIGSVSIDLALLVDLDLSSVDYFGNVDEGLVEIELRYGEENNCFVNDDGRSRVTVSFFRSEQPATSITTYMNCDPVFSNLESGVSSN